MRNRRPDRCSICGKIVGLGEGVVRKGRPFLVSHIGCYEDKPASWLDYDHQSSIVEVLTTVRPRQAEFRAD